MPNSIANKIFENKSICIHQIRIGAICFIFLMISAIKVTAVADSALPATANEAQNRPEVTADIDASQCADASDEACRFYGIIAAASQRNEVDAALVMAIIQAESRYDPKAVSLRGAKGLMQLMPGTAESLGVVDCFNPEQNVEAGVRYFKQLLEIFKGDRDMALAAYNAGLQNVLRHGGVPPFPATRQYIRTVQSWYDRYKSFQNQVPDQAEGSADH